MIIRAFSRCVRFLRGVVSVDQRLTAIQEALGRIERRQLALAPPGKLADFEFKVYSQWGEDGVLQYLIDQIPNPIGKFVEFGVEDYMEANTRFLLSNNNWAGLVIDGSASNIEQIRSSPIYWRRGLTAVQAFVTAENIDQLLAEHGFSGEIDVLSIDIDGNDYWVWKAISTCSPRIVVIEYNWRFGAHRAVTIPYDPAFVRSQAHPSCVYFGASLAALGRLGLSKGYALVGVGSAGLNAFFVRRDVLGQLPELSPEVAYRPGKFKEARNVRGELALLSPEAEVAIVQSLPVVDVGG